MKYLANFSLKKKQKQKKHTHTHKNTLFQSPRTIFGRLRLSLMQAPVCIDNLRIPNDTVTGKGKHLSGYTEAQADIDLYWLHMH